MGSEMCIRDRHFVLIEVVVRDRVPQNAIADYYLDEHEVSVAQFRRFLDDEGSEGSLSDERRAALLAATTDAPIELPMTGVHYAEAAAYASWAGKELPTYLHWEFAVRGEGSRPAAHSGRDVDPSAINAGTGEPWPCLLYTSPSPRDS